MTVRKFTMGKAVPASRGTRPAQSTSSRARISPIALNPAQSTKPKTPATYPGWAPHALRRLHTQCVSTPRKLAELIDLDRSKNIDLLAAIEILGEFTFDARMERVWTALGRGISPSDLDLRALRLAGACFGLLANYFHRQKITTTERKKRLRKIADLARDLEEALSNSPSPEIRDARPHQLVANRIPLAAAASERPLTEHLKRLAERASQEALMGSPFAKTNASEALRLYVTRHLSKYFRATYGSPFPHHVTAVAEVLLRLPPGTISAEAVRLQDHRTRTKKVSAS